MSKSCLRWLVAALILVIYRLVGDKAGYPGWGSDYASHMAIAETLRQHPSVLWQWPVPYWGIVLSHVFTWPLTAAGMDITRSMLVVHDLALISALYSLWQLSETLRTQRACYAVVLGLCTFLGMTMLAVHGFYSQAISFGFFVPALVLWIRRGYVSTRDFWCGAILIGLGTLTYPDAFLWLSPLLALAATGQRRACRVPIALGWLALFAGQLRLMHLDGAGGRGLTLVLQGIVVIGVVVFLVGRGGETQNSPSARLRQAFLIYLSTALLIVLYSLLRHGEILYYARKNFYAVYYWAPLLWLYFSQVSLGRRGPALALAAIWVALGWREFLREPVDRLADLALRSRGSVSQADRLEVSEAIRNHRCAEDEDLLIVPSESPRGQMNTLDARISRLTYANLHSVDFSIERSSFCWQGSYVGFIAAGELWQKHAGQLSGTATCHKKCAPLGATR